MSIKRLGFTVQQGSRPLTDTLAVAAAVLASIAMIQLVTASALVTLAYAGGLVVLGLVAFASARRHAVPLDAAAAEITDWSVTACAIEQPGCAVAITDRANRLVCANAAYELWFGSGYAPPRLPVDGASSELLSRSARAAWRDGECAEFTIADERQTWTASAQRAGRADEYLVWRFTPVARSEPLQGMGAQISGMLGAMLSAAGIEVALVGADGAIRTVSRGFARRACGDETASLTGQEFVSLLRADERDRIYFAREGRKGSPQMLLQVPLADPEAPQPAAEVPVLMLLLDSAAGFGGWGTEVSGQTPQLEGLLEQLPLGLAMTDRDGHFLFANPAFRRAAGVDAKGVPPYPSDLVVRQDKTALSDAVRRYAQGPASSGDIAVRLRREPDEPVSLGLAGVRGLGEAAVLLSLADTTEETRLRRQVAQATKMQAVGQLAGGVAHDFNNVLTAIIGYCDLMLLRHTPGDSDYDDIQQIRANSNRAASLTRQLLAFSRQQTLQPEVLQLPDVLAEVSQLLKRLLGAKITLRTHHDRNLGPVRADPRQLEQVIINLAVNARDAIQAKHGEHAHGTLSFSTRRVEAIDIRRMGSEIIPAGDYTVLIAEDTGGGIAPEHLSKIFEPFFTTKEVGKGTGLGLSTVYGIVKQSGGFIFADNAKFPDGAIRGARFTIYLPVHHMSEEERLKVEAEEDEETREWSGGGRILLVEDEDMVRAVAERALARQGYAVVTASDGEEGVELIQSGEEFDLVVSDVVMPSMDGPAMAREIRKLHPRLPVLFMSGYAEEQLRREIDIDGMHFIAKPFSVQQIAQKVEQALRANRR
ncbi:histidine kinase [Altererythrobacter sp. B11]|uniref:hybrid sensor histidine kinase/response regulator n=1 Tax=Altererythrobacter sp. B11 TaxID=2060312 RepID=UPI000DC738DF|nr:response regulator [Altererythrobacter sp. B11]BBC72608.1 histidine kinase [Altererythrobacter sp. B11]